MDKIELTLSQDLKSGQVEVKANQALSFSIVLRLFLLSLKGLKDSLVSKVENSTEEELIRLAFGEAYQAKAKEAVANIDNLKEEILCNMEGDMYDTLNVAISSFLDEEFPRVNSKLSLTEEAAAAAGLDRTATTEELVQAEKDLINNDPELAAQCAEMQPTEVKELLN